MIYSSEAHTRRNRREAEYLDGWQRARAELDNFRKRILEEQGRRDEQARATAVEALLTVAEHFQAIVHHVPETLRTDAWVEGVLHIAREFDAVLRSQGVIPVTEVNIPFNPAFHEAVGQVERNAEKSGVVLEVIQPGYKLGDKVLRPARVKVSS